MNYFEVGHSLKYKNSSIKLLEQNVEKLWDRFLSEQNH